MTNGKLAEKALAILNQKSKKALKKAKELILKEKFGCRKAREAIKYYVSTWNDTTRPGVLALAHEAVRGKPSEVIPLQTAMLFIDAAMDIHDDIIDKSATKNARQTICGKFGEETALLLGNALLVKGFNQLYRTIENLPCKRKLSIIDTAKDFLTEVIDGHILEVELRNKKWNVKPEEYFHVLKKKAADIEGHMRIGATFGGGSVREIKALSEYGRYLGILLAIRSDFIDVYEPNEIINRVKHECLPIPVVYALQNNIYRKKILEILTQKVNKRNVEELIEIIYQTSEVSHLKQQLDKLREKALLAIDQFSESRVEQLRILTLSMLEDL